MLNQSLPRKIAPNMPLELTPLRVERDRSDFEGWCRLNRYPTLSGRRSSSAGRWAAFGRNAITLTNRTDGDALEGHGVLE